jgi:hypothetical protein
MAMEGDFFSRSSAGTLQRLQEMYTNNTLTDITLLSHDDQPIYAHSCVLSSASTTIQVLLCSLHGTLWGRKLKFVNVGYDTLKYYVDSLYVEDQKTNRDLVHSLLMLCSFLKDSLVVDRMAAKCVTGYANTAFSIQVFGNDDNVMTEIVDIDVMDNTDKCSDMQIEKNESKHVDLDESMTSELDITDLVNNGGKVENIEIARGSTASSTSIPQKEGEARKVSALETVHLSDVFKTGYADHNIKEHTVKLVCGQVAGQGDAQQENYDLQIVKQEPVEQEEGEDVQQEDSSHQSNILNSIVDPPDVSMEDNDGNDGTDWMCKKCNISLCRHRCMPIKEKDLHHFIRTEGYSIEEPHDISPLDFSKLRPGQRLCAEKYQDVLNLPYKLLVHRERDMKKSIYRCPYCDCYIFSFSKVILHYLHHGLPLPLIKCSLCEKTFRRVSCMRKHDTRLHKDRHRLGEEDGTHVCTLCGLRYCTEKALERHMDNHDNDLVEIKAIQEVKHTFTKSYKAETDSFVKTYSCEHCTREFNELPKLKNHYRLAHNRKFALHHPKKEGPKTYMCQECGIQYSKASSLHFHKINVHATSRDHQCQLCGKAYKTQNVLQNHVDRVHGQYTLPEGEISEHQCSVCGRFLPSMSVYKAHMKYHRSQGKPLQCRVCDATFKYHSCRLKHELQEHGMKAQARSNIVPQQYA